MMMIEGLTEWKIHCKENCLFPGVMVFGID